MKRKLSGVLLFCFLTRLLAQQPANQTWQTRFEAATQQETERLDASPRKLDCTHLEVLKKGRPIFVGANDGVRIGVSTQKDIVAAGEPVLVDTWVDNRTDKPAKSGGRCPPYLYFGDVFDESGHRLIGIHEQETLDAEKKGLTTVQVCASTEVLVEIPAHSCKGPIDAHETNWRLDYKLAPGLYYVFPGRGTDPALFKQGLPITVREP